MLTDTYGGVCPNCGYDRMCMRYGRGGYFQYDACPNCAFALGEWYEQDEKGHWQPENGRDYDIWSAIFSVEEKFSDKLNFEDSLAKYRLKIENLSDIEGEIESVFSYSNFSWSE